MTRRQPDWAFSDFRSRFSVVVYPAGRRRRTQCPECRRSVAGLTASHDAGYQRRGSAKGFGVFSLSDRGSNGYGGRGEVGEVRP